MRIRALPPELALAQQTWTAAVPLFDLTRCEVLLWLVVRHA